MKKRFWIGFVLLMCVSALGQEVKTTPASQALVSAAKEFTETQKALNDALQQARTEAQTNSAKLQADIQAANKALSDKLHADKKYAADLANIDALNKQAQDFTAKEQQAFQAKAGPLQQKVATDGALIDGLIPVVRKENGWTDGAAFDKTTQKWTVPPAAKP